MGLVVIGRLAHRHGFTVSLRSSAHAHGLVASVTVPVAQLVEAAPAEPAAERV